MAVLDNLNKGAAGGGMQWMNRLLGIRRILGTHRAGARLDLSTAMSAPMDSDPLNSHLAQVFAQYPIEVAHGEGVWLYARDGRKILDFYGGHAVAGLGYGHPRWLAALERQARQMAFQTNALPMAIRERAAARLAKFAGLGLDTVFWVNSGAEANENALKLAFKMTGRTKAVALEQGWHGRTAAAGAVTWGALEKWYGFPRTPFDVSFVPRDNPAAVGAHRRSRNGRGHRRTDSRRGRRLRRRQADAAGTAPALR